MSDCEIYIYQFKKHLLFSIDILSRTLVFSKLFIFRSFYPRVQSKDSVLTDGLGMIPYLGIFMSDLTFLNTAQPDYVTAFPSPFSRQDLAFKPRFPNSPTISVESYSSSSLSSGGGKTDCGLKSYRRRNSRSPAFRMESHPGATNIIQVGTVLMLGFSRRWVTDQLIFGFFRALTAIEKQRCTMAFIRFDVNSTSWLAWTSSEVLASDLVISIHNGDEQFRDKIK